jgi:hypothetical protein
LPADQHDGGQDDGEKRIFLVGHIRLYLVISSHDVG